MDSPILEKLLATTGLGGVCVGIFMLIFREALKSAFISRLTKEHSFQVVRSLLWLTWSIAVLGLLAWIGLRVLEIYDSKAITNNSVKPVGVQQPRLVARRLERRIPDSTPGTNVEEAHIKLDYIEVAGLDNKTLQKKINEYIKDRVGANEHYDGTEDLTMELVNSSLEGDLLSVLVEGTYYGHGAAGAANQVRSINLNIKNGEPVEFKDLFRAGYKEKINRIAESWFSTQSFDSSFESVKDDQCYYFDGSYLYLCFSEYEVAAGAEGVVTAKLKLDDIRGLVNLNGPLAYVF
ncbi:RsiV family protein [Pseudomonas orientalis]|uniref:RsiV family protein n=1 Tax=Pseudomonas orientalis TaxID=76758 RepID=UPI0015E76D31|nr:RsiV family protein [Pseudomonas orientalis]MBA1429224.1 DUF3298 domain-containing protein [Pseudomonas orientalis]